AGRAENAFRFDEWAAPLLRVATLILLWLLLAAGILARLLARLGLWLGRHLIRLLHWAGVFAWRRGLPAAGWLAARLASYSWRRLPWYARAAQWVVLVFCLALL